MTPPSDTPSPDPLVHYLDLAYYKWVFVLGTGLFIALFLLFFLPFGVSNFDPDFHVDGVFVACMAGVFAAVSGSLAVSEFVLRPRLLPSPSRRGMLGWLAWDVVLVSSACFVYYNVLGDFHDWHWSSWLGFLRDIGVVMAFPLIAFVFYLRHESLKSAFVRLRAERPAIASTRLLHLQSDNEKDHLAVALDDLLYLQSQDNYLSVVHVGEKGLQAPLIRSSLKRIESLGEPGLLRCHRSFVVNLGRVRRCEGNLHGLRLLLEQGDRAIPVSRAYVTTVLAALQGRASDPSASEG